MPYFILDNIKYYVIAKGGKLYIKKEVGNAVVDLTREEALKLAEFLNANDSPIFNYDPELTERYITFTNLVIDKVRKNVFDDIYNGIKKYFPDYNNELYKNVLFKAEIIDSGAAGCYNCVTNEITISYDIIPRVYEKYPDEDKKSKNRFCIDSMQHSFSHEALHMFSTQKNEEANIINCGLSVYDFKNNISRNTRLTEGITEYFNYVYTTNNFRLQGYLDFYPLDVYFARKLILLVGIENMADFYFNNKSYHLLEEEINKYSDNKTSGEDFLSMANLFSKLDKRASEETLLPYLEGIITKAYINKIKMGEVKDVDDIIEFSNCIIDSELLDMYQEDIYNNVDMDKNKILFDSFINELDLINHKAM